MNILAIGAHFDDVELGCGGTLAKHVAEGDKVYVFVATSSGFKSHNKEQVRCSEVANIEGQEAMKILGIKELFCGNYETLKVEFVDSLNIKIIRLVEDLSIDLVYTHWVGDIHHDHQAVAKASIHSCRHVKRMLMYRSNWYHSTQSFAGNFYVDISKYWQKKEESIKAHKSEMKRTGEKWIKFFKNEALNSGQRIGVELAEVYEVLKWIEM